MPTSFTLIAIILLYVFVYKKVPHLKVNSLVFATILSMFLLGFFVPAIHINNKYYFNVLFGFTALFLAFELFINNKTRYVAIPLSGALLMALVYFGLAKINSDFITVFNYLPIAIIISVVGVFFAKNTNLALLFVVMSFVFTELINFAMFSGSVGILDLFSYHFVNALVVSVVFVYFICVLYKVLENKVIKKQVQKGGAYEK